MNTNRFSIALIVALLLTVPALADSAQESLQKGKEALVALKKDEAIAHLTEAIRKDPNNAEAFYYRGRAYSSKVQPDKAIADFDEAIRLNPKFGKAFLERGRSYFVNSDFPKAIADLSEAIRLDPKDYKPLEHRASTYYESGEYAKAIADYKNAIQLEPKSPSSYWELAQVLAVCPDEKYRDGKKAVEYATEACKLTEEKVFLPLEALAAGYAELGQFEDAVKWEKKAIEVLSSGGPSSLKGYCEDRLKQYEQRKPLRYRSMARWLGRERNQE